MVKLTDEMKKFLVASVFGDVEDEEGGEQKQKIACAKRAYLDLARVIPYRISTEELKKMKSKENKKVSNEDKQKAEDFENIKEKFIKEVIEYLISDGNLKKQTSEIIKNDNEKSIDKIILKYDELGLFKEEIKYGMKQKWINMTRKYFWLFELISVTEDMDIPIDSYIIDALFEDKVLNEDCINTTEEFENLKKFKRKKLNECKFPSEWINPWSQWDQKEYDKVQELIRDKCKKDKKIPMAWENDAWIKQARKRNNL